MPVLGVVRNISHRGLLIVKAETAPKKGTAVLDESRAELGRVTRVFGPVKGPYVTVKPAQGRERDLLRFMGMKVYVQN